MLRLGLAGMRAAEIINLRICDLQRADSPPQIRFIGKGRRSPGGSCRDRASWPPGPVPGRLLGLHCIVDNLKTHDTDLVHAFFIEHPHVHLHFTPTHASWLNQVELFFSILERRLLRRGEFDSVDHLAQRIIEFIKDYNRLAAAFRWTYDGGPLRAA